MGFDAEGSEGGPRDPLGLASVTERPLRGPTLSPSKEGSMILLLVLIFLAILFPSAVRSLLGIAITLAAFGIVALVGYSILF